MNRTLALAALLLLGATAARADGLYLGAGVGQFDFEVDSLSDIGDLDFEGDDTSLKAFAGWRFNKFLAVELAYVDFGTPSDSIQGVDVDVDLTGFAPYVVATLPLPLLPIEFFAKVGYYFYDVEATVRDATAGTVRVDDSDEDLVYGAGIGLSLFDKIAIRLEYEQVDLSDVDTAEAIWLTGAFRF